MALGDDVELGPKWTEHVSSSMGPKTNPRLRSLMSSFTRHIHDLARKNELTVDEWMAAVNLLNDAGKMSDDRRSEGQLLRDIIGLESYIRSMSLVLSFVSSDSISVLPVRLDVDSDIVQSCRCHYLQEGSRGT